MDFALGPFAVSYARTKIADFPVSIFVIPHRLYMSRPRGETGLSDFFRLFHPVVSYNHTYNNVNQCIVFVIFQYSQIHIHLVCPRN